MDNAERRNKCSVNNSAGPSRFAGWINETGKVSVAGPTATMTTLTNFVGSANLAVGSNVVSVVAWDSQTNLATNGFGVVVASGIPVTLKYDANGNLTNQYTSTYTNNYAWDGKDRLIRVTRRSTADPIEYTTDFLYDGLGRRVKLVERTNGVVDYSRAFIWCGTELCEKRGGGGGTLLAGYFGQGEFRNPGTYFYTRDHLGSVREMVGGAQLLRARLDYDPYGRRAMIAGDTEPDLAYTGHFYHGRSTLHLAMFRGLDSGMGRWLSRDPIEESASLNIYRYVSNDPISRIDLLGLNDIRVSSNFRGREELLRNMTYVAEEEPRGTPQSFRRLPNPGEFVNADAFYPGNGTAYKIPNTSTVELDCVLIDGRWVARWQMTDFIGVGRFRTERWAPPLPQPPRWPTGANPLFRPYTGAPPVTPLPPLSPQVIPPPPHPAAPPS